MITLLGALAILALWLVVAIVVAIAFGKSCTGEPLDE